MASNKIIIWAVFCSIAASAALATPSATPLPSAPAATATDKNLLELPSSGSAATPVLPPPPAATSPAVPSAPAPLPVSPAPAAGATAVQPSPNSPTLTTSPAAIPVPSAAPAPAAPSQLPGASPNSPTVQKMFHGHLVAMPQQEIPSGANAPNSPGNSMTANALSAAAPAIATKNSDIIFEPLHLGNTSLLFTESDMHIIEEGLEVYDKSARALKTGPAGDGKDDLTGLLDSLKSHDVTAPNDLPPPLPNLYLGSIVYYSPSHWSVWINGRKLMNTHNQPTGEFYVDQLSRSEIELIWHPATLQEMPARWDQLTQNGASPPPGIVVDEKKGTVTLRLHPNQTFLPRSLAIREGLIKSLPNAVSAAPEAPAAQQNTPPTAQDIMAHPFSRVTR